MRPCQIRSYTIGRAINRRARRGRRENERETADSLGCSASSAMKRFSGGSELTRQLRGAFLHSFGAALADEEQADSLQKICRRIHSPSEEHIGLRFMIVNADLAGDED